MELFTGFQHIQYDRKLVLQQRTLVGSNIYVVKIKQCLFFLQNLLDSNPCQQPHFGSSVFCYNHSAISTPVLEIV